MSSNKCSLHLSTYITQGVAEVTVLGYDHSCVVRKSQSAKLCLEHNEQAGFTISQKAGVLASNNYLKQLGLSELYEQTTKSVLFQIADKLAEPSYMLFVQPRPLTKPRTC